MKWYNADPRRRIDRWVRDLIEDMSFMEPDRMEQSQGDSK